MTYCHVLQISLRSQARFLFPSVDAAPFGLDRAALRDKDGNALYSGSAIASVGVLKGILPIS